MFNQNINKLRQILLVGIFSVSSIAVSSVAQAEGWYAGVGFGQSTVDIECDLDITCSSDDTDTGWKLFVGNRFSPNAAIEFGYLNFGEAKFNGTDSFFGSTGATIESSGFNMALAGFLPISKSVNLIGKVGLFRWDVDASVSTSIGAGDSSESGIDPMFGIGASFDLGKDTAVRIEWERFTDVGDENETGKSDVDLLSASLVFRFQ